MDKFKTIKLTDMVNEIQGNKNINKRKLTSVIYALPKVIKRMLLEQCTLSIQGFIKFGHRNAKDRITKSRLTGEELHMPAHRRFKATFYKEFKNYLNE